VGNSDAEFGGFTGGPGVLYQLDCWTAIRGDPITL